ncbi:saccharopine dehydrogenase family protein [soil metagenome]
MPNPPVRSSPRVLILGCGMVGSVMAIDMARAGFAVTLADARADALAAAAAKCAALTGITPATKTADLSSAPAVAALAREHDLVLGALASRIALGALGAVIAARKPYCDISFMAEDATSLSPQAEAAGVCCVVDCGVAPGMSHILSMHGARMLARCDEVKIVVGGLPRERRWPFQYKAAFAPSDVLEEYTRPVRLVRAGQELVVDALTERELIDFAGIGTLEAFNTDGLRSLVHTLKGRVPTMIEKTLRYPGHIELMAAFRATGLMGEEPIEVGGVMVSPRALLAKLMFPHWTYQPGEEDLTVMRVSAAGISGGKPTTLTWDLLDFYSTADRCTSMARTTALPCTIVARLMLEGRFKAPGVHPPERLAEHPGLVDFILAELAARAIQYRFTRAAAA